MKRQILYILSVFMIAACSLNAGSGATSGLIGGGIGYMIGRSTAPRERTTVREVVYTDNGASASRVNNLERTLARKDDEIADLQQDNRRLLKENQKLNSELRNLKLDVADLQKELREASKEKRQLKRNEVKHLIEDDGMK
ncbi:MAG: hypothetical protein BWY54_00164 [Candidatus Dependentiae bacterium ADurb.Bin331]|nr:MAG: hypothetical protein BWY54_00164 [Candidatus Dependentiae bacterium ADurb.Bin331]